LDCFVGGHFHGNLGVGLQFMGNSSVAPSRAW
jgi:hypothetical protein